MCAAAGRAHLSDDVSWDWRSNNKKERLEVKSFSAHLQWIHTSQTMQDSHVCFSFRHWKSICPSYHTKRFHHHSRSCLCTSVPNICHSSCCAVLQGYPVTQVPQLDPCVLINLSIVEEYDAYEGSVCSTECASHFRALEISPWPIQYFSGNSFCWFNLRRGQGWSQKNVAVWIWNLVSDASS